MEIAKQIARQLRAVHFGGNWTDANLRDQLADVTWQQAVAKQASYNTIAALVFHINYYVSAIANVLQGNALTASDKWSFNLAPLQSQLDWEALLNKTWRDAEQLAMLLEAFPDAQLNEIFAEEKYGTYYYNLHGLIEHTHYHLGQIVLLKKGLL